MSQKTLIANNKSVLNVSHLQRQIETWKFGAYRKRRELSMRIRVEALANGVKSDPQALLDSGCTNSIMDVDYARSQNFSLELLPQPVTMRNFDGTENAGGKAHHGLHSRIVIGDHEEKFFFLVVKSPHNQVILGIDWLSKHNPDIDWVKGTVTFSRCPPACIQESRAEPQPLVRSQSLVQGEVNWVAKYPMVFSEEEFAKLPPHRNEWDLGIGFLKDPVSLKTKLYPLTALEGRALDEWLTENLASGRIRPSTSPYASPFFFKKERDKLRPIIDYSRLNSYCKRNRYPLPLIRETLDALKGSKIFSKMDVRWGFNNLRIREGDEEKAAFITQRGLFEPTVMQFGLQNAPGTFQRWMNHIFKEEIDSGYVRIYVDDILVFTIDLETHRYWVKRVLDKLKAHGLCLRESKCKFEVSEVEFLGLIVKPGLVMHSPERAKGVREWPHPKNVKELQRFLGLMNYYRRFIPHYAEKAKPLHGLTGKNEWKWEMPQEKAFEELRSALLHAPILALPKDEGKWKIETDASQIATGGILSQQQEDGSWKPVDFISGVLSPAERNYDVGDREFLAIIRALREWRAHLLGVEVPFEIWTDHSNLRYFCQPQKLKPRHMRWVSELQAFNYEIKYLKGSQNTKADALSRRPDHGEVSESEQVVQVFPQPEVELRLLDVGYGPEEFLELLQKHSQEFLEQPDELNSEWSRREDNLWTHGDIVWVPPKLRQGLLVISHDAPVLGHPGIQATLAGLKRYYYWSTIADDVRRYVSGCVECQRNKPDRNKRAAPLHPHKVPEGPWHVISWDIVGPLPNSRGYNAILVIVDRFTKMTLLEPIGTNLTAQGAARILRDRVFRAFGVPKKVISDRGPQFVSHFMSDFYKMVGIKANPSTAFHPQTDGQTERVNQEVEIYLRHYVNHLQDDWADWMASAEFALNSRVHSVTGFSPFYLNHGRHPWNGNIVALETPVPAASKWVEDLEKTREIASKALELARSKMAERYDKTRVESRNYCKGDLVWLDTRNLQMDRPSKKLGHLRSGPFAIEEKVGASSYRLRLPPTWKIHPVFNEVLLTPYKAPAFPVQQKPPPPPPVIADDHFEWEVECILDHKRLRGQDLYLVKWKGYGDEENTWEPEVNLSNAKRVLNAFKRSKGL